MKPSAFQGLRTVVYHVTDVAKATQWYRGVLGIEPYFDEPFYVGFNVGGFELGLHPADAVAPAPKISTVAYWGVERAATEWERLQKLGAEPVSEPADVGEGIVVATLRDPFGNLIGIIENPHFPNTA